MTHSVSIDVPTVKLPWTDPALNADPLAVLEKFRDLGPVVYNDAEQTYMVLSFEGCNQVLEDPVSFSSTSLSEIVIDQFGGITMEAMDDRVQHSRIRGVWSKEFARSALEKQRELVTRVVDEQVGQFIERIQTGEVLDAVSQMTRRIPTVVIANMLGLDPALHEEFSRITDAQISLVAGSFDHSDEGRALVEAGIAATRVMNSRVACEIAQRRLRESVDLIGLGASCPHLSEEELLHNVTQLVVGGNETTARLMAVSLVILARHPEQRRLLAASPKLLRPAIEELLRMETIVQWMSRMTSAEVEVAGVTIPADTKVAAMLGVANRDPGRWDRPDEFDIARKQRAHLAFGTGMHTCLGLNLTRLEMEIFLERLLRDLPDWEIIEPPAYGRSFPIRGPERLMLALAR